MKLSFSGFRNFIVPFLLGYIFFAPSLLAQTDFGAEQIITESANGVRDILSLDFNDDGDIDIISANSSDNRVVYYSNYGDGTFQGALTAGGSVSGLSSLTTGTIYSSLIDILSGASGGVYTHENLGGGNFQLLIETSSIYDAESLKLSDFDSDGNEDLLFVASGSGTGSTRLLIKTNLPNPLSSEIITLDNAFPGPDQAAWGDLDGDGDLDVVAGYTYNDGIKWFENTGSGNFSEPVKISSASSFTDITTGDVDNDGDDDIVVTYNGIVSIIKSNGNDSFATISTIGYISGANEPTLADMDDDGYLDLVTRGTYAAYWFRNNAGSFETGKEVASLSGSGDLSIGDIDDDGYNDVIISTYSSNKIAWYKNRITEEAAPILAIDETIKYVGPQAGTVTFDVINEGTGTLEWRIEWVEGGGNFFGVTQSGDENTALVVSFDENQTGESRTGKFNLVADDAENSPITLTIEQSPFLTTDIFGEQIVLSDESSSILDSYPVDIDGDMDIDILTLENKDGYYYVAWYQNINNQSFAESEELFEREYGRSAHAADVDDDGDIDIITGDDNPMVALYKNNGNMEFSEPTTLSSEIGRPRELITADLDNDGDLDILGASTYVYNRGPHEIYWFENNANSGFSAKKSISTELDFPQDIIVADLDDDGDLDVVSASSSDHKIAWYKNDGAGNLGAQIVLTFAPDIFTIDVSSPNTVQASDFDGDGDLDLVVGSAYYPRIAYLENTGNATFSSDPIVITSGTGGISDISVNDFDFDGDPDIAAVSTYTDEVLVLLNDGGGTVSSNTVLTEDIDNPTKVFAVDLDNDGDADILASSSGDNKLTWHKNLTVNIPNKTPVANADEFIATQDNTLLVESPGVLFNDSDEDDDALTAELISYTGAGTLDFESTGAFSYTPEPGFSGVEEFTYRAFDGTSYSENATVTLTVKPKEYTNAKDDWYYIFQGSTLEISAPGVMANDSLAEGTVLTTLTTGTLYGSVTLNEDGSFTYYPASSTFSGATSFTDTFIYTVETDAGVYGPNSQARVYIVVADPPSPPYAVGDTINYNGSFTEYFVGQTPNNYQGWRFYNSDYSSFEISDDAVDGDSLALKLNFGSWNESETDYHVEALNEPLYLIEGETYTATFFAKADTDTRKLRAFFGTTGNWGWTREDEMDYMLSTEWHEYEMEYTATGNDTMAFLMTMNFEENDGATITIDNLTIEKTGVAVPILEFASALNDTFYVYQNMTLNVAAPGVLTNDTLGINGNIPIALNSPYYGSVDFGSDGSLSYTPVSGDSWGNPAYSTAFQYQVQDSEGMYGPNSEAFVVFHVIDLPIPPYAIGDSINYNGSFEKYTSSNPDSMNGWVFIDSESSSFKIVNDSYDEDDKALQASVGTVTEDTFIGAIHNPLFVAGDDSYTATFYAKSTSDAASIGASFLAKDTTEIVYDEFELTDEWSEYSISFTSESDDTVGFGLGFSLEENENVTILVDKVSINKTDAVANEIGTTIPVTFALKQNYPNPFNPSTKIGFDLPESANVSLVVYDLLGRQVSTILDNKSLSAGSYSYIMDASNLTSGVYIYRIQAGGFISTKKMTLIK